MIIHADYYFGSGRLAYSIKTTPPYCFDFDDDIALVIVDPDFGHAIFDASFAPFYLLAIYRPFLINRGAPPIAHFYARARYLTPRPRPAASSAYGPDTAQLRRIFSPDAARWRGSRRQDFVIGLA